MSKPPKFTKNVRYNPATGTEQYDGELVTAPREWQSAPDHPPTKLAYITEPEARVLSELDLHGSGVSKEKHFGPKGIPSYNGYDGNGGYSTGGDESGGGGPSAAPGVTGAPEAGYVAPNVDENAPPPGIDVEGYVAPNVEENAPPPPGALVTTPGEQLANALKEGYQPRGLMERAMDALGRWTSNKAYDIAQNPARTGLNIGIGLSPLGPLNTLAGLVFGPENTLGAAVTAGGRAAGNALGLNSTGQEGDAPTQTAEGRETPSDPYSAPDNSGGAQPEPRSTYQAAMATLAQIANPNSQTFVPRQTAYNAFTGNPAFYGERYAEHNFFPQMAEGGVVPMAEGGFVIPADVVSGLGDGSTKAGYRRLGLGQLLEGPGTGMSDDIPAHIDGEQPAAVADGEVYLSPKEVALVGGGRHADGVKRLYALMDEVRKKRHGTTKQPKPLALGDL